MCAEILAEFHEAYNQSVVVKIGQTSLEIQRGDITQATWTQ